MSSSRRTAQLRPIHLVLSLLLALAGVVAIGGPAQAAVDSISGTVTTPASTAGISVYLSQELNTGSGPAFDGTTPVTTTDASGDFSFTGVPNGEYLLVVDAGDDWVQFFSVESIDGVTSQTPLTIDLVPGVAITGTVRDAAAPFSPLANIIVFAAGNSSVPIFDWLSLDLDVPSIFGGTPFTDSSGNYRFVVPLDDSYQVQTFDLSSFYADQSWDHRNGCGCDFDPIVIPDITGWPHAPITGTNFDLLAIDDWIWFSIQAKDLNGIAKVGTVIHLDQWNGSSWVLDVDTATTDSGGFADLYGFGDGDYRLRYSEGGVFKAIDSWYEPSFSAWPLADGGKSVELPGLITSCSCGGSLSEYDVDLAFPLATSGGGTPATPRKPHKSVTPFTAPVTPTATPTPTPTPTSTPTPSTSPSASDSPTPTAEPTAPPTQNLAATLWWLWIVLALVLALIVYFFIRLVRGRR